MQAKNKRSRTRSAGLGDTIVKVTKATGIDKLVHFVAGEDCGCEERRKKLNEWFPYRQTLCLTEAEHDYLKGFFATYNNRVEHEQQVELLKIYNRIFNTKRKTSTCAPCVRQVVDDFKFVMKEYKTEEDASN
jgi:hypothetical protein